MNLARVLENTQITPATVAPRTPRQITQITPLKMMQDILKSPDTTCENRGEKLKELWTKWIQREIKDCIDNEEAEIRHAGRGSFPSPLVMVFAALTERGYWYRQITMGSGEVESIHHPPIPEASEAPWWVTSRAALTVGNSDTGRGVGFLRYRIQSRTSSSTIDHIKVPSMSETSSRWLLNDK